MVKPTAIVVGVGAEQGVGGAVCREFATERSTWQTTRRRVTRALLLGWFARSGHGFETRCKASCGGRD